jgi:guanylate kinase
MDQYEYLLINDKLDICVEEMHHLIQAQHRKVEACGELIAEMREQLKAY